MTRFKILMADDEISYLSKLELMLLKEYGDEMEIYLVTDRDYLDELFKTPQKLDVLVINETMWKEEYRKQGIQNIFFLNENETPLSSSAGTIQIYKYSSVKNVVHTVNVAIKHLISGNLNRLEAKVILFYSPQGGSGKTTLATGTAKALSKLGNKILYIDAEMLQAFGGFFQNEEWGNRNLINALSSNRVSRDVIEENIIKGEVHYLLPLEYSLLSNGIQDMNYYSLIQTVKSQMTYDYIIVDTSSEFNEFKARMIASANHSVITVLQDRQGAEKIEALFRNINVSDKKRYTFVCNKFDINKDNFLTDTSVWSLIQHKIPIEESPEEESAGKYYVEIAYGLS